MLFLLGALTACGSGGGDGAPASSASGAASTASETASASSVKGTSSNGTATDSSATAAPSSTVLASDTPADAVPAGQEWRASFRTRGPLRTESNPFEGMADDAMWWVEQRFPGRASVVDIGRDGGTGLRLHTEPGDSNVEGSGSKGRNDVAFQNTDGVQGRDQWWAHSILFPDDFAIPPMDYSWTVVFDFHNSGNWEGQANFHVLVTQDGLLTFRGHGGPEVVWDGIGNQYSYGADIGPMERNVWYDFVYHVRWSHIPMASSRHGSTASRCWIIPARRSTRARACS